MLAGTGGEGTTGFSTGGVTDSGSNSISDLETEGVAQVKDLINTGRKSAPNRPVHVMVRAHSRGGVAGTMVANDLKSSYGKRIEVELVDFDPVPGPDAVADEDKRDSKDTRYNKMDISQVDASTIVYSVAANRGMLFTPQQITGAKRIIVSQQDHSAALAEGFVYDGKRYKGSALNNLAEGVYMDRNESGQSSVPLELIMGRSEFEGALKARADKEAAIRNVALKGTQRQVHEAGEKAGFWARDFDRIDIIDAVLKEFYFRK